jgi:hypothetical protein
MVIQLISKFPAVAQPAISSNFSTNCQLDSVRQRFCPFVVDFITTISAFYGNTLHYILHARCALFASSFCTEQSRSTTQKKHKVICKFNQDANFFTFQLPHSFIHPFTHSFVHLFIHQAIHSSIHASIQSSIHSFINSFVHSPIHSFIYLSIHPFIPSSIYPSTHSFFHPSIPSFIHSFIMRRR